MPVLGNEPITLTLPSGGVLDGLAAGPHDGPPVLLLHGFPQDATAYAEVLPALAEAGLRAVAVSQRGYSPGHRPRDARAYALPLLAEDALAVLDVLGVDDAHVVGHDWGAVLGWHLAGRHPARVRTLTAVSVPHPAAYMAALLRSPQALRSAYVPFFRAAPLAARVLGARDGLLLRRFLIGSGLPAPRAEAYTARLLPDDGLRAALAWYRNAGPSMRVPRARVPTTYVWSDGDVALDRAGAERTGAYVDADYHLAVLHGASHWVPETRPSELADLIVQRTSG